MNIQEQIQRGLGFLFLMLGVACRILHISDFGDVSTLILFGFFFTLLPYQTYSRRLKVENEELRRQMPAAL